MQRFRQLKHVFLDEDVLNKITCFQSNGSKEELVDVQHTIPDINAFQVCPRLIRSIENVVIFRRI